MHGAAVGPAPFRPTQARQNRFLGYVEAVGNGRISGRAVDQQDATGRPIVLFLFIDSLPIGNIVCNFPKHDFAGLKMAGTILGFDYPIPAPFIDGKDHEVCLRFQDGTFVKFHDGNGGLSARGTVRVAPPVSNNPSPGLPEIGLSTVELEELRIIESSGVFDAKWYLTNNPDVAAMGLSAAAHYVKFGAAEGRNPTLTFDARKYRKEAAHLIHDGQNPFVHYILHSLPNDEFNCGMLSSFQPATLRKALRRLVRLPLYADSDYVELNSDILAHQVEPSHHALVYGFPEGRTIFHKATVSRVLGRLAKMGPCQRDFPKSTSRERLLPVSVFFNSDGNGFIQEIADDLVNSFRASGLDASLHDEKFDPDRRSEMTVIVAPHEFFHLGDGEKWARDDIVTRSLMFNTEQPQTLWFERGVPFCLMSAGVIDICSQVATLFADAGIPAIHFNPRPSTQSNCLFEDDFNHPLVRILPAAAQKAPQPEASLADRPIDVSFFGGSSDHRDRFFARHAAFFADLNCFFYYRRFDGPQTNSWRDSALSRLARHIAGHSKIVLNIHRDDFGFFEWHRIVKTAMMMGAVVVSEPNLPHTLYRPNEHYLEETGRHMPDLIEWLLKSEDGRAKAEEIRANAMRTAFDEAITKRAYKQLHNFFKTVREKSN